MADTTHQAQYESPKEALKIGGKDAGFWQMWMGAIDARSKGSEGDWRKLGDDVVRVYRSQRETGSADRTPTKQTAFNVLYSNTETLLPALYNSLPIPDIRRRFGDPGKPGKAVAQILERALTYSLDRYDFEAELKPTIFDSCVPGRGIGRVRLIPRIEGAENDEDEEGLETPEQESDEHADLMTQPEKGERVTGHDVRYEYVHWKNYRQGPGLTWSDVPWIAFEHFMSREQLEDLLDGQKGAPDCDDIPLNWDADGAKNETKPDQANAGRSPDGDIFKRAHVWEVWDKKNREVIWLCSDYPWKVLCRVADPLKLEGFFPVPRPLVPIETPGDMTPVPPYEAYRELAEELNEVSDRIRRLARQVRVRGLYSGLTQDLQNITQAADGELVPVSNIDHFIAAGGDLNKIIGWWPIEPQVKAIAELVEQRERIKETINEVSGLSDILRGQTEASETATAQNIKSQWGSLRIQRMQQEIARYIRDIFRIKAELIANHYDIGYLSKMTNVELATEQDKKLMQQKLQVMQQQAQMTGQQPQVPPEITDYLDLPTVEEVEPLLRDDLMRSFKIDVESDSTIRADLTRNQQVMSEFVQGTAAYIQAVGPAVQAGLLPANVAVDIYAAFSRNFKLGKQVEDSLDKLSENANKAAQQPQPPKQDPEMVKAQAEIQIEQQRMQMEQQKAEHDAMLQQKKIEAEIALKKMEMEMKLQLQQAEMQQKLQLQQQQAEMETAMAADRHEKEMAMASEAHQSGLQRDMEAHTIGMSQKDEAHRTSLMQADEAHQTKVSGEKQASDIRVKEWQAKQEKVKPTPRSVKFNRGKDGKIAGAEIN